MPLADHHDMVEAFPSNRANHPLRIGVLPRRAGRNNRLLKLQRLGLARKAVSITEKDPRRLITRAIRLGGGAGAEARPATDHAFGCVLPPTTLSHAPAGM
jgi:hypothetical protein